MIVEWKMPDVTKSYVRQFPWVTQCEFCTFAPALEGHHMLIHRMKGIWQLDLPYNICWVCHNCHENGAVNAWEARQWFWNIQVGRYGYNTMNRWLEGLPLKIKPIFKGD